MHIFLIYLRCRHRTLLRNRGHSKIVNKNQRFPFNTVFLYFCHSQRLFLILHQPCFCFASALHLIFSKKRLLFKYSEHVCVTFYANFLLICFLVYSRSLHFNVTKPLANTIANPFGKTHSTLVILIGQHLTLHRHTNTHIHMCCHFQFAWRFFFKLFPTIFLLSSFHFISQATLRRV